MLGVDMYNGTSSQVQGFKNQTGATYPLLLYGHTASGGDLAPLYCDSISVYWDNYLVISKQGIVRYHAALTWPHGERYHLDEIRGSVDTLVTGPVGVEGRPAGPGVSLALAPNPVAGAAVVSVGVPSGGVDRARVTVLDPGGRLLATLWDGPAGGRPLRLGWGLQGPNGRVPPGVYLVRAEVGHARLVRRIAVVR